MLYYVYMMLLGIALLLWIIIALESGESSDEDME